MAEVDQVIEPETLDLFQEPEDFYPPEKEPTFVHHKTSSGQELTLRLVGHNPLWGHLLWQAGRAIADYLERHASGLVIGKTVLELGAGAGLPSLICALRGAAQVVVTDYPDVELIANLRHNIESHAGLLPVPKNICAEGHLWGSDAGSLLAHLPPDPPGLVKEAEQTGRGFELLILADVLFNHSEHGKLLATVQKTLVRRHYAHALVFFTPYRPWLLERDLAFFELARGAGFEVAQVLEYVTDRVMFEHDPGDEMARRTVFGYEMHWSQKALDAGTEQ